GMSHASSALLIGASSRSSWSFWSMWMYGWPCSADELRLYHAGLASDQDLAAVRTALAELG
ncbi:hypothetical protein ABZ554_25755, partial [Streptomyces sp. NPDC020125]|uniref:hypothetical protein n=1 Tax=Streptomyces sp. NPDC020125 TaxID=3154593 RepID=UPI0033EE3346